MTEVCLSGVSKSYGDFQAVDNLNLSCESGQMLALLGPSGCGKTTTLSMMAGINDITGGSIKFGDREVSHLGPGERNIAMVFEDYALYPHLSVFENIAFPLRIRGLPNAEIKAAVNEMLDLLHLNDLRNMNVKKLSGGAQQRIAIGRALIREPDVILFDEPLSHLDADQKIRLRTEIRHLQQSQNLTSILVTHDQTEAFAMADRVAVMNQGVLQQLGSPQELYDNPANTFVATFIGEPPMNLLDATVTDQNGDLTLLGSGWASPLSAELTKLLRQRGEIEVVAGLRPERMRIANTTKAARPQGEFEGNVFFREHRGDTNMIVLETKSREIVADPLRIFADLDDGTSASLRKGDHVRLAFNPDDLCLFSKISGQNLNRLNSDAGGR